MAEILKLSDFSLEFVSETRKCFNFYLTLQALTMHFRTTNPTGFNKLAEICGFTMADETKWKFLILFDDAFFTELICNVHNKFTCNADVEFILSVVAQFEEGFKGANNTILITRTRFANNSIVNCGCRVLSYRERCEHYIIHELIWSLQNLRASKFLIFIL